MVFEYRRHRKILAKIIWYSLKMPCCFFLEICIFFKMLFITFLHKVLVLLWCLYYNAGYKSYCKKKFENSNNLYRLNTNLPQYKLLIMMQITVHNCTEGIGQGRLLSLFFLTISYFEHSFESLLFLVYNIETIFWW